MYVHLLCINRRVCRTRVVRIGTRQVRLVDGWTIGLARIGVDSRRGGLVLFRETTTHDCSCLSSCWYKRFLGISNSGYQVSMLSMRAEDDGFNGECQSTEGLYKMAQVMEQ